MTRSPASIVLIVALGIACAALWLTRDAAAQFNATGPQYEYLLLVLDDQRPVALSAGERIEIQPPARLPTGRINDPGVSNDGYSLRRVEQRHVGVGALNVLGSLGWEAVATVPHGNGGSAVLMKRRVAG